MQRRDRGVFNAARWSATGIQSRLAGALLNAGRVFSVGQTLDLQHGHPRNGRRLRAVGAIEVALAIIGAPGCPGNGEGEASRGQVADLHGLPHLFRSASSRFLMSESNFAISSSTITIL